MNTFEKHKDEEITGKETNRSQCRDTAVKSGKYHKKLHQPIKAQSVDNTVKYLKRTPIS